MNSNSQWDQAQAEWALAMGERHHQEAVRRPHPTGHLPMPEGEVDCSVGDTMPDYDGGDVAVNYD